MNVLDLCAIVLADSLDMTYRCRNIYKFDTCHELYFIMCILLILLSAFVG